MNDDSFRSIERLVEFGLSMSVAQQIASSVNQAMQSVTLPGEGRLEKKGGNSFYVAIDGKAAGPFTELDINNLIANKHLSKETLVWMQGMSEWKKAQDVPAVLRLILIAPPPVPS